MRHYLAGPMTGHDKYNFPAFEQAATKLREQGYEILSPHEIEHGETEEYRGLLPYQTYLRAGLKMLLTCNSIIMLPGWEDSVGANLELSVAKKLNYSIYAYLPEFSTIVKMKVDDL